jgi:hypothetical protein
LKLTDASDAVLGTLGIAATLVVVPILWKYVGSVYVRLISEESVGTFVKAIDGAWRFIYRLRLFIYVILFNYTSSVALYFTWQLATGVTPYRILWQAVGAGALSIPKIDSGAAEIKSDDDKETKKKKKQFNYTRRRKQVVAIVEVSLLIFITDRGAENAQQSAVIFTIWVLALAGVKSALNYADKSKYGYYISERVAKDVHLPVEIWVTLCGAYAVATIALVGRTLASY